MRRCLGIDEAVVNSPLEVHENEVDRRVVRDERWITLGNTRETSMESETMSIAEVWVSVAWAFEPIRRAETNGGQNESVPMQRTDRTMEFCFVVREANGRSSSEDDVLASNGYLSVVEG